MGVSGDFNALRQLRSRIQGISKPGFKAALVKNLAQEARTQVVDSFQQSRDPYGRPWLPLKRRAGMPLLDTGRLRNSLHATPTATGFEIGTNVVYAAIHQYGGKAGRNRRVTIPQRQYLPDPSNLGPIWTAALVQAADSVVQVWMGKR